MSTLVYGWDSAGREAAPVAAQSPAAPGAPAPAGTPAAPGADGADEPKKKGFSTYVDIVAAIVPAEVLALNAVLIQLMTETDGSVTEITEPGTLEVVFWLSIVTAIGLYLIADRTAARKKAAEESEKVGPDKEVKPVPISLGTFSRALIPAAAYVAWVMLQKSTAFDAVAPGMEEPLRMTVAAFGAVLLGALAKLLLDKADEKVPPEAKPV